MELWIRSQDRETLGKAKEIMIYEKEKRYEIIINCYTYGTYATKKRALEVLDEIHQRLINLGTIEIVPDSYTVLPKDTSNVYEMPKE